MGLATHACCTALHKLLCGSARVGAVDPLGRTRSMGATSDSGHTSSMGELALLALVLASRLLSALGPVTSSPLALVSQLLFARESFKLSFIVHSSFHSWAALPGLVY